MMLLFLCALLVSMHAQADLEIKIAQEHTGLNQEKLLIGVMPSADTELFEIAKIAARAIGSSKQFAVDVHYFDEIKNQAEIRDILNKKYALVIFVNQSADKKAIEWRLYDSSDASMVKGKKMYKRGTHKRGFAYQLADDIWSAMMHEPSSFTSKLAFIKRKKDQFSRPVSIVCMTDCDGSHEEEVAQTYNTLIGLHWNNNIDYPQLCISEFTRFNVRLISFDLQGNKRTLLDTPGTCVGISFSKDNNQAVYCKSGEIWHYIYNKEQKKGMHTLRIKNDGKNTSPILLESGDIIFCSDSRALLQESGHINGKKRIPKIYYYQAQSKKSSLLTKDGYCVAPAYCAMNNKVAYSKQVKGVMQLFVLDLNTNKHEQLTNDIGDKTDGVWSACGTYLFYCYHQGNINRIVRLHVTLNQKKFLTNSHEFCVSPAASPLFVVFPTGPLLR